MNQQEKIKTQQQVETPRAAAGPAPALGKVGPTLPGKGRLRPSGGYRTTRRFQAATLIYDATYRFCEKFLDPRSRTVDQMVQAARSGRQNIAEGSRAAAVSSQTELRLVNVARASLEELLLDYEDFLRHRRNPLWAPNSPEAMTVRKLSEKAWTDRPDQGDLDRWALYSPWLEHQDPAVRANAVICLIHQANYLLDHQILALEKGFATEGGYSEALAAARLAERQKRREDRSDRNQTTDDGRKAGAPQPGAGTPTKEPAKAATDQGAAKAKDNPGPAQPHGRHTPPKPANLIPDCPVCQKPMVLRTAKTGKNQGHSFWGCSNYPKCKGTVKV